MFQNITKVVKRVGEEGCSGRKIYYKQSVKFISRDKNVNGK
ncbi:hypothetical protein BN133_407 [Cronobacter dublinensis 582]|nr:hypothetical protein BN133_407 [Cronobacter dublinensis 582]